MRKLKRKIQNGWMKTTRWFWNGVQVKKLKSFIYVLDYIIPAIGTKRFGGSRSGMIGTTIGLIIGILSPIPFGIIIGPFVGALVGEMIHRNDMKKALKAAFGSFLGFIASTFLKFIVAIIYLGFFIVKLSEHNASWL